MPNALVIVILPWVALSFWYLGSRHRKIRHIRRLSRYYLSGLNYLLNDEPDKGIEIFIKKLDVTPDTIATHLAFGNVFRRQGEVDRAIRIHQNLIEHPEVNLQHRRQALLALAKDYLSAGILDRAEQLLLDVVDQEPNCVLALEDLLDIYQQEHNWHAAIRYAKRVHCYKRPANDRIAHYYCELANVAIQEKHLTQATWYLKQAIRADATCIRVQLMQAECAVKMTDYQRALHYYQQVMKIDNDLIAIALPGMRYCYKQLQQLDAWQQLLLYWLKRTAYASVILHCVQYLHESGLEQQAQQLLIQRLRQQPTIAGLSLWLELSPPGDYKQSLAELAVLLKQLNSEQTIYRCANCGYKGNVLHWLCPSCKTWNTFSMTGYRLNNG